MDKSQPRMEILFREFYRQALHSAAALFILPLRWLGFWYALVFAGIAFFWNLCAMPRFFPDTLRPEEKERGYSEGMLAYPVAILILALFFPRPILAGGWAVLSMADGLATLSGRLLGGTKLFWNRDKSWMGFLVYFVSAAVFGWMAMLWTWGNLEGSGWVWQMLYPSEEIFRIKPLP